METKIDEEGVFRFSVEPNRENQIKYLESKGVYIEDSAKVILSKASEAGFIESILLFIKKILHIGRGEKNDKINIVVLDSEHISSIGTKCTTEDALEAAKKFNFLPPTINTVSSILKKFDAEDFLKDMGLNELVFLHKPVKFGGSAYVLVVRLSSPECYSYDVCLAAVYFYPKRKWGEKKEDKVGFVFIEP